LPIATTNVAPDNQVFISFVFSNSVPYEGIADVYKYAQRARGNMVLLRGALNTLH
jgi:hypothetical protein